jgi:hypothetical protein
MAVSPNLLPNQVSGFGFQVSAEPLAALVRHNRYRGICAFEHP